MQIGVPINYEMRVRVADPDRFLCCWIQAEKIAESGSKKEKVDGSGSKKEKNRGVRS